MTEIETEDLHKIATQIFRQAFEDYIRLQHSTMRAKKYLDEAYLSAIDMFWDQTFRFDMLDNDENKSMDLTDFLKLAADRENIDLEKLKVSLRTESRKYWRDKMILIIPDNIIICGVPFDIVQGEYHYSIQDRIIRTDKKVSDENFIRLFELIITIIHELTASYSTLSLAQEFYYILKMNNGFKEVKAQKLSASELELSLS